MKEDAPRAADAHTRGHFNTVSRYMVAMMPYRNRKYEIGVHDRQFEPFTEQHQIAQHIQLA